VRTAPGEYGGRAASLSKAVFWEARLAVASAETIDTEMPVR
jgi:hypothetical protein